jgi:hypothetical protein
MAQPSFSPTPPHEAPPETVTEDLSWKEVVQLLRRVAQLAAERGVDTDMFMQAAWMACLEARPGLREELEDKELLTQLEMLRQRGLVPAA